MNNNFRLKDSIIFILGIGDWGLGIGDWAQSPIPNPQSPIPNPHLFFNLFHYSTIIYIIVFLYKTKLII
jgi:hypothetical protein